MKLSEAARVIRSKNAGPLTVTVDLMFSDELRYQQAADSPALTVARVAGLYDLPEDAVRIVPFPQALAIKLVLERSLAAGSPGDQDVYGAQQHAQLLDIDL